MIATPLETLLEQLVEAGEHPDKDLLQAIQDQGEVAVPHLTVGIPSTTLVVWTLGVGG